MSARSETLATRLKAHFGERLKPLPCVADDVGFEVAREDLLSVCRELRDDPQFGFEQLIDLAGIDYLDYGRDEWNTYAATRTGFSRAVNRIRENVPEQRENRFAVVYQLLSVSNNWRLRLRCYASNEEPPVIDSVVDIWASANWYEREAFDLFGIFFNGHPDLRRILTDYGFIGHPFRKDFPLIGNVEVKYDPAKGRVVYQPVSIEPRTLVPRVIRKDNRYEPALKEVPVGAKTRG
ncbi:MAG: NADH-quinone oxidoreductase subunit C [Gammaproteobacteria bacterium]|nr:NADH-quinone oxidoreductase subunit C [Gammaproteobacteria bacterium]